MPMQSQPIQQECREPSEGELRRMLEARELELETERMRMSRKLTKIVCVTIALVTGAILCFPGARKNVGISPKAKIVSAESAELKSPDPDLKPFMIKPEKDSDAANVRFGTELFKFLNFGQNGPAAK